MPSKKQGTREQENEGTSKPCLIALEVWPAEAQR